MGVFFPYMDPIGTLPSQAMTFHNTLTSKTQTYRVPMYHRQCGVAPVIEIKQSDVKLFFLRIDDLF